MTRAAAPMTSRESLAVRFVSLLKAAVCRRAGVFVCAAIGAARLSANGSLPNYVLAAWATEKGLPPGDVFAIAQDVDGYLWLGTPNGLIRFDGSRFTPWTPSASSAALPSGPVHAIVGSADGSLWVGFGGGGGVVRILRGEVYQHAVADGAPPGVTAMIQDRQGTIWVATRRGPVPVRERPLDAAWARPTATAAPRRSACTRIAPDSCGRARRRASTAATRNRSSSLTPSSTNVQSLTEDAAGAIWVTDSREILRKLSTHAAPQHEREIRLPAGAWRLLRDSRNQIWVAAFGGGLLRVRDPLGLVCARRTLRVRTPAPWIAPIALRGS